MKAPSTAAITACRMGMWAAFSTVIGALLSGPLALIVLARLHPQPPWQDAELFARHFHPSQTFPYFVGFFLVGGYVVLMASLHGVANEEQKARTGAALAFTSAFAALVFLNYIVQTTFVPQLAKHYVPENAPIIAQFSMANPASLAWALEMWAWGFFGVATWLAATVFSSGKRDRFAASTLVANGVSSVVSALCTAARPEWVLTTAGLLSFTVWNLLVLAMSTFVFLALRERIRAERERSPVSARLMHAHLHMHA
jgi:hypothetical protein